MAPKGSRRQSIPINKIRFLQSQCYAKNDDRRWLIALISDTGIRLAEACGLLAEDIIINHQIPHLVIRPHHWRVLKTESSTRKVPLVGASLWAAQNLAKDTSSLFAFPRYCSETGVKADSASGALNKWIRPHVPKGCVIHSFRHSFRDRLREIECPPDVADQIGGWQTVGISQQYGEGYSLSVMHKWLKGIE